MSNSKKLLLQPQLTFTSQLWHDVQDAEVLLPSGTYEAELMGSGGQAGGAGGGAGARGQFHKFQFRIGAPVRARIHLGTPGGRGSSNGGAAAGGTAGGSGAMPTWIYFENIPTGANFVTSMYRSAAFDPNNMTGFTATIPGFALTSYVASVWGGGGGGGKGQDWATGKYLPTRQGGAGGGWYYGWDSAIVQTAVNAFQTNPGGVTFSNGQEQIISIPGKASGSNGSGSTTLAPGVYGGGGGTSGRDYGGNPQTARTGRIYGSGAAGANGAVSVDNNHNSSYYGAGGGGAGGGPNGIGGAGGAGSNTAYGEAGYNYTPTPSMVTNPLTGAETNTDWGAGGNAATAFAAGTWGWVRLTRIGA